MKAVYQTPQIVDYGALASITLGTGGSNGDGGSSMNMAGSDVETKDNVLPVAW